MLTGISSALARHGLILRGGFHPAGEEGGLLSDVGSVLLIGNAGGAMWEAFSAHIHEDRNPLDRWTQRIIDPIAEKSGARAIYPFGADVAPFQRWALRAETVYPSPLGILIHPEYGLWHAYRAALLFSKRLDLPQRAEAASPCESCAEKPCLTACPVGAFTGTAYDVTGCASHLASAGQICLSGGCVARNACPIGTEWRYPEAQTRFHMAAFSRSVAGVTAS